MSDQSFKKKRMGPIAWIKTYGYYYKGLLWIGILAALLVLAFVFLLRYDGADLRLYTVTKDPIDDETFYGFLENVNEFVYDVDGDKTAITRQYRYTLTPTADKKTEDLAKLPEAAATLDCLSFVVDEDGYAYVKGICQLRELAYFEIQSDPDDPYRLTLNDTELMAGLPNPGGTTYYLVMKYIADTEYNDVYTSGRTDILVGMARNIDSSEENNVTITKK
ncbi:MAG: hypothetical protein ACOXZM_05395 [Eubacteriales bacterium]|jgi:hypothetical protein